MTEIVVALVGTHEYEWAVWIFATLFKKYWGEGIIAYVGDRQEGELPANVQFYRVPCYSEGVWVWAHWFGNGLNSFFERCGDTPVLLFLPDQWLKEPVWHEGIYSLARYMRGKPDIIRGNVTADVRLYGYGSHVDTWEEWEIWQTSVDSPHASLDGGLTFCPSLWNPRLAREIRQMESEQKNWFEENKKLIAGIAIFSSPARVDRSAREELELTKRDAHDILRIRITGATDD